MRVDRLKVGESIQLDVLGVKPITVKVVYQNGTKVGIGVEAPADVKITRKPSLHTKPSKN